MGGNGFIAAFVGGLAFGVVTRQGAEDAVAFTEAQGSLLAIVVWTVFGITVGGSLIAGGLDLPAIAYAILSLTVVRMVPVALALVGCRFQPTTVAFIGWFGPRGLASIVFMIIALEDLHGAPQDTDIVVAAIGWTVLLSVVLHGITAVPLARRYGARIASIEGDIPERELSDEPERRLGSDALVSDSPGQGWNMMSEHGFSEPDAQPRAPRSAGLAGIAFSVLFLAFALLLGARPPASLTEAGLVEWFEGTAETPVTIAVLYVAPFAGIAFLWFLAVVRDRIGAREDRFLSTVFLGSGLLFVAMFWAGGASLASLVAGNRFESGPPLSSSDLQLFRSLAFSFLFVFAARAAAVFMIVTSTIALRTAVFPRWLGIAGYVIAVVMLLSLSALQWVVLLFPVWVFVLSLFILNSEIRVARAKRAGRPDTVG